MLPAWPQQRCGTRLTVITTTAATACVGSVAVSVAAVCCCCFFWAAVLLVAAAAAALEVLVTGKVSIAVGVTSWDSGAGCGIFSVDGSKYIRVCSAFLGVDLCER